MAVYALELRDDFINKVTHASPVNALAELIWNSLDADASLVEVKEDLYGMDQKRIIVVDNGHGFSHKDAPGLFSPLGGSWKHLAGQSKGKKRFLHGAEGQGRLKAFALGSVVDWEVCYLEDGEYKRFTVSMLLNTLREVRISDPEPSPIKRTGVRCVISELRKNYEFLQSPNIFQEMSELFATYLKSYKDAQINLPSGKLDISIAIAASKCVALEAITEGEIEYPFELELIEWKNATGRVLYLCNEAGMPLTPTDFRVQVPGLNFSAYLKSTYISKLSRDGTLGLGELNPVLANAIAQARDAVKTFHRERVIAKSKTVVEQWKEESIYPFKNEPASQVERIEREIFDIVAVKVSHLVPDFDNTPQKGKKLQLRMLKQAIEQSPEDLQLILTEVLDLSEKSQKEFAQLLKETSLTAIISASKVVADRLRFLTGLKALLFDTEEKKNLKERTQLHRLLAENTWIFGEEFFLSVDDQSLTEVLRKHLKARNLDVVVDEPVLRVDGKVGIIDLMLTRNIPCHREDELDYLIIELKRPAVKIGSEEINQIKGYALAVAKDERFRGIKTRWTFWIISNDMDEFGRTEANQINRPHGVIWQLDSPSITVWAKTWSEVLHANQQRLRLFQDKLELNADKDSSLQSLKETYSNALGRPTENASAPDDEMLDE